MAVKNHTYWQILRRSMAFRDAGCAWQLFRALFSNILHEIGDTPIGVRRTDLWKLDPEFVPLYQDVYKRSALNAAKLYTLYALARRACRKAGDIAEFGVYRGGSARLLAKTCGRFSPSKQVLLCDTFEGMPCSDKAKDHFRKSDLHDTDFKIVQEYMADCSNIVFYKGLFSSIWSQILDRQFCFVHVDVDLYQSVYECSEFLYPV